MSNVIPGIGSGLQALPASSRTAAVAGRNHHAKRTLAGTCPSPCHGSQSGTVQTGNEFPQPVHRRGLSLYFWPIIDSLEKNDVLTKMAKSSIQGITVSKRMRFASGQIQPPQDPNQSITLHTLVFDCSTSLSKPSSCKPVTLPLKRGSGNIEYGNRPERAALRTLFLWCGSPATGESGQRSGGFFVSTCSKMECSELRVFHQTVAPIQLPAGFTGQSANWTAGCIDTAEVPSVRKEKRQLKRKLGNPSQQEGMATKLHSAATARI